MSVAADQGGGEPEPVDNMGFYNALNACFTLHELNHSHWAQVHENGYPIALEEDGIPNWKRGAADRQRGQGQGPRRAIAP